MSKTVTVVLALAWTMAAGVAQAAMQKGDIVQVATDNSLKARPVPDAEALSPAPAGAPATLSVRISNTSGDWWYVEVGGKKGWLPESALVAMAPAPSVGAAEATPAPPAPALPEPAPAGVETVTATAEPATPARASTGVSTPELTTSFGVGSGRAVARGEEGAPDLKDQALKFFVAFPLTKAVQLEVGYVDLGDFSAVEDVGSGYTAHSAFNASGLTLALEPQAELSRGLVAFGKVGLLRWKAEGETVIYDPSGVAVAGGNGSDEDIDAFAGVGLKLALGESLLLYAAYERHKIDTLDIDTITGGLEFAIRP